MPAVALGSEPMPDLAEKDVRALLEFVGDCYSQPSLDELRPAMLPGLTALVPNDITTYNEVDFAAEEMIAFDEPAGTMPEEAPEFFVRYGEQNPLVRFFRAGADGRPRKWSDFIDRRQLHATDLYRLLYERMGVEYQMAFTLPSAPELLIGLALNRGRRDFSERDRAVLNLVRPHLIQAYDAAREYAALEQRLEALARGVDDAGRGIVVLERDGSAEFATQTAARALGTGPGSVLPPPIDDWIREQRASSPSLDRGGYDPLFFEGPGGRVIVRLLPARKPGERDCLVVETGAGALSRDALRGLGLSDRQADVLRLVALGHTNASIADELEISPRTVEKHVQAIFRLLGVRSRSAAAATAWAGVRAAG
jgi:DNA-binding CsgD family transcriptional regulator